MSKTAMSANTSSERYTSGRMNRDTDCCRRAAASAPIHASIVAVETVSHAGVMRSAMIDTSQPALHAGAASDPAQKTTTENTENTERSSAFALRDLGDLRGC